MPGGLQAGRRHLWSQLRRAPEATLRPQDAGAAHCGACKSGPSLSMVPGGGWGAVLRRGGRQLQRAGMLASPSRL